MRSGTDARRQRLSAARAATLIFTAALMAALVLTAVFGAAAAHAELRTGARADPFPGSHVGTPTRPGFKATQIRYDDVAGTLAVTVSFDAPLVDPATSSALREWKLRADVGDFMGAVCSGSGQRTWGSIVASLGDATPPALGLGLFGATFDDPPDTVTGQKTFTADRSQITVSFADPRLVGLNWICAAVQLGVDGSTRNRSSSFSFLLDGFSVYDGEIAREAGENLDLSAFNLSYEWSGRDRANLSSTRCRRTGRTDAACRLRTRVPDIPGRPTLTVTGSVRYLRIANGVVAQDRWRWNATARLAWPAGRCPSKSQRRGVRVTRLRGGACRAQIRWRGEGQTLDEAFGVIRRSAG